MRAEVAGPADDAELRRVLADNPMEGEITVSFEREPNYFAATTFEGGRAFTIVTRDDASGRIAAQGEISVRKCYVNGRERDAAYLGLFRVDHAFRGRPRVVELGFRRLALIHAAKPVADVFYGVVVSDNTAARRRLEPGRRGNPAFFSFDELVTFLLPVRTFRPKRKSGLPDVRRATKGDLPAVAEFLASARRDYQFAPVWTERMLASLSEGGAFGTGILLVIEEAGGIVASAALWDQRACRQVRIRGYERSLARMRPILNAMAPFHGAPELPAVGQRAEIATIAAFGVTGNRSDLAFALIEAARDFGKEMGIDVVALALSERHPLTPEIRRRYRPRDYRTRFYVADAAGAMGISEIDQTRCSFPEAAML